MLPPRCDLVLLLLVATIGVVFGHLQVEALPGLPDHGRYHASDMDDLQLQILGHSARPENYAAGADHPVWYLICGVHQKATAALGWEGLKSWYATTAVLPGINLVLFLILARRIGFTRFQSFALTMLFLGSGATVTWSVVLETHVLAPTSLLAASLVLTRRGLVPRIWRRSSTATLATFGASIAIAASITITNGMLAALTIVPARFVRRPRPIPAIREIAWRSPTMVTAGLVATGILAFLHIAGWYLWQDPSMQRFLEILGERRLLPYMVGSPSESILALAWIAPPMSEYVGTPPETML
ncbi:MAG: hypothetical protein VX672_01415, partial [Planctomycetota bacterium]|nr:hypothetical protein [Planctomycetota bacterium]